MSQSELVHSFFRAGGGCGGDSLRHISQSTPLPPPHRAPQRRRRRSLAAAILPSLARYEDGCTQIEVREFPLPRQRMRGRPSITITPDRVQQSARMQTAVLAQDPGSAKSLHFLSSSSAALPRLCRRLPFVYPSGAFNGGGENTAFPTGCLLANPSESEGSSVVSNNFCSQMANSLPFHPPLLSSNSSSSTKRTLFFGAAAVAEAEAAALPDCCCCCCYGLLSWGPFYKEPFNIMLP